VASKDDIAAALAPLLKAAGFTKQRLTWHRATAEVVGVLNAQQSQWSDCYYLNLGLYLRALGPLTHPPEHQCQVRVRLDELVPDRHRLHRLLDFEDTAAGDGRVAELAALVGGYGVPWLVAHADEAAVAGLVAGGSVPLVTVDAREHLAGRAQTPNQALHLAE
jgi:hypothetical protein